MVPRYGCQACFLSDTRVSAGRLVGSQLHAGLQMTDGERPLKEKLALQIIIRNIDLLFEECSKFEERNKKILFDVIGNLLLQHMRQLPHTRAAKTSSLVDEAPPRIRELADTAATNGIRQVLLSIADLCEVELQQKEEPTPPSPAPIRHLP